MKISLKNVGMLDEAEFEAGNITLICGENNTGKTYATYSLYGYLDFMRLIRDRGFFIRRESIFDDGIAENENFQDKEIKLTYEQIKEKLEKHIREKTEFYSRHELTQIMAGKESDFANAEFRADIDITFDCVKNSIQQYLEDLELNQRFKRKIKHIIYDDGIGFVSLDKRSFYEYSTTFFDSLLQIIFMKNFILSVERTGASIFQKELDFIEIVKSNVVQKILKDNSWLEIIRELYKKDQLYPKPVRDNRGFIRNIEQIVKKESIFKQNKEEYKHILELLVEIIGGRYHITEFGEISFQPDGFKKAYNIEIASSSVRSLLMLNFYILHIAQKNDILMIDEPELNLHPKNQILIARLFSLLANAGIKIFITTHSDYIVRELSNCVMLYNLSDKQIEKLKKQGYSKDHKLKSNDIKAYLAENIKGKNTLRAVQITQEQGIFMETFDEPIDSQNENQGLIFEWAMMDVGGIDDK